MDALAELVDLVARGQIDVATEASVVNLHCHTFFSFNAYGYSPAALAWLAKVRGFYAVGIVDFDVLDAVDEFLTACDLVGVRGSAGIETRTFIPEFATREINSPGEPGVYYHMGIGFTSTDLTGFEKPVRSTLAAMLDLAQRRNREMLSRINRHLAPVTVDFDRDVVPMTPAGNVTERHMLFAIIRAVQSHFASDAPRDSSLRSAALRVTDASESANHAIGSTQHAIHNTQHAVRNTELSFWSEKLAAPIEQIASTISDAARFFTLVRGKLMKKGSIGYVASSPEAFPTVDEVSRFTQACGALPCATWLDGLSAGEQAIHELLGLLIDKGAVALNIIPDRNWNIADPEVRRLKVAKLHEIVRIAAEYDLPLNIGTEMNAPGNKLVDDFDVPEMTPLRQAFLDGAAFVYGHNVMQRALGLGYQSAWAVAHLPTRRERNAFYAEIGRRVQPSARGQAALRALPAGLTPRGLLAAL